MWIAPLTFFSLLVSTSTQSSPYPSVCSGQETAFPVSAAPLVIPTFSVNCSSTASSWCPLSTSTILFVYSSGSLFGTPRSRYLYHSSPVYLSLGWLTFSVPLPTQVFYCFPFLYWSYTCLLFTTISASPLYSSHCSCCCFAHLVGVSFLLLNLCHSSSMLFLLNKAEDMLFGAPNSNSWLCHLSWTTEWKIRFLLFTLHSLILACWF